MSIRRRSVQLTLLALTLACAGVAWVVAAARQGSPSRDITLVAREMAFYLPGDPTPNPTLALAAGEMVRLTLINEDHGMLHDVAVAELGFATPALRGGGSSVSGALRAPRTPGEHEYLCSLHPRLMRGRLVVTPS